MKICIGIHIIVLLSASIIFSGCGEEEDEPVPEKIDITTLRYVLETSGGTAPVILSYRDLDGIGGQEAEIVSPPISADRVYFGTIELLNEAASPAEDVTALVQMRKEDFQMFFVDFDLNVDVTYADQDADGNPIGLFTALRTGDASSGTLVISLKTGLNKFTTGVSDGIIDNATGTTEIQVTFPVIIE